jgi:hypothetical protein
LIELASRDARSATALAAAGAAKEARFDHRLCALAAVGRKSRRLIRRVRHARVVKDPPPWLPNPNRYTVGYLVCADVWLPLRLHGGELRATTALVRRDFTKPDRLPAWEQAKREARTRRRTKASAARLRQQRDRPPRDGEWE